LKNKKTHLEGGKEKARLRTKGYFWTCALSAPERLPGERRDHGGEDAGGTGERGRGMDSGEDTSEKRPKMQRAWTEGWRSSQGPSTNSTRGKGEREAKKERDRKRLPRLPKGRGGKEPNQPEGERKKPGNLALKVVFVLAGTLRRLRGDPRGKKMSQGKEKGGGGRKNEDTSGAKEIN